MKFKSATIKDQSGGQALFGVAQAGVVAGQ